MLLQFTVSCHFDLFVGNKDFFNLAFGLHWKINYSQKLKFKNSYHICWCLLFPFHVLKSNVREKGKPSTFNSFPGLSFCDGVYVNVWVWVVGRFEFQFKLIWLFQTPYYLVIWIFVIRPPPFSFFPLQNKNTVILVRLASGNLSSALFEKMWHTLFWHYSYCC